MTMSHTSFDNVVMVNLNVVVLVCEVGSSLEFP